MLSSPMSKDYTITTEIRNIILHSTEDGVPKKNIIEAVMIITGWGKTKVRETIDKVLQIELAQETNDVAEATASAVILGKAKDATIYDADPVSQLKSDYGVSKETMSGVVRNMPTEQPRMDVEDCGTHTYNHATDQYIWQLKDGKTNVVIGTAQWKAMLREYKGGSTIQQIALKHYLLPPVVQEVFKKEGITHDSFPSTSQDLKTKDADQMTEEERKFAFAQELEKASWKATQADANKWREFEYGTLEPFQEFLSSWKPKAYATPVAPTPKSVNNDTFVIGLSDLHFGSFTSEATTFSGKSYSTKQAVSSVALYLVKIKQKLQEYKNPPNNAVILLMGDILHTHTNNGMTTKGTQLKYDVTGPEQLQTAFDSLYQFTEGVRQMFNSVGVHSVRGNHSGNGDYALALALEQSYRSVPGIVVFNYKADHALVEIGSGTLAILTHGASDEVKAILPSSEAARQTWAMNIFAQYDGNLSKKKQKLLLSADQHHIEVCEYASFTHYMFPTAVSGDHYAESKGLSNRAAQLCLVVGDEGVINHIPIYL